MMGVVLILAAILIGVAFARMSPEQARTVYRWVKQGRRLVFGTLALAFAIWFVMSGVFGLMLVGFLVLVYATLLVIYEEPHKQVKSWIT